LGQAVPFTVKSEFKSLDAINLISVFPSHSLLAASSKEKNFSLFEISPNAFKRVSTVSAGSKAFKVEEAHPLYEGASVI